MDDIKKNSILNMVKTLSTILYPLITFPYITRVLGTENVGKVDFGNGVAGYFSMAAMLGILTYGVRECSCVRDDKEKLGQTASELISLNVCTMFFSYIIMAACLILVPKLRGYQTLILIQSTAMVFTVFGANWLNTAMEDFTYITVRTLIVNAAAALLTFLFVKEPEDYLKYAAINVLYLSCGEFCNVFRRSRFCKVRLTFKINWKKHLPPVLLLFAMVVSQNILNNIDVVMLGFMKTDYDVGLYSTALKITCLISNVIGSVYWVVMPQLTQSFSVKNYEEINDILNRVLGFFITLTLPCAAGMVILSEEILVVIGGAQYREAADCMKILTFASAFTIFNNIWANMILLASKREKEYTVICVISMVLNLIMNVFLIPRRGVDGAAVSTVISAFMGLAMSMSRKDRGIHFKDIKGKLAAPVMGTVFIVLVCILAKIYIGNVFARTGAAVVVSVIVYGAVQVIMKNPLIGGTK